MSRPWTALSLCAVTVLLFGSRAPAEILSATFIGGSESDSAHALVLSPAGDLILAGTTQSPEFPTTAGAYDSTHNGYSDIFLVILTSAMDNLIAGTIIGGNYFDNVRDIFIDHSGDLLLVGETASSDFPTTPGAFDPSHNGGQDVFVARMTPDLSTLLLSSFLGGTEDDYGVSSALDPSGKLIVAGSTRSADFPVTPGSYDTSFNHGNYDVFLARLSLSIGKPLASTFIGGGNSEGGRAVTTDENGEIFLAGGTLGGFPVTSGAFDSSYNGGDDAFVLHMSPRLDSLLASTYVGGSGDDNPLALVADSDGSLCLAGFTRSVDFPVSSGAYDTTFNGPSGSDAFVLRLNHELDAAPFSTYLGGNRYNDHGEGLAIGPSHSVLLAGSLGNFTGADSFLAVFSPELDSLLSLNLLGGNDSEQFEVLRLDDDDSCLIAGGTYSPDFPVTSGAFDTSFNGRDPDAYLARLLPGGFDTAFASLQCDPEVITLPMSCQVAAHIRNLTQTERHVDAGLSLQLPEGTVVENFRFASLSIDPVDSFGTIWLQSFPPSPSLEGMNIIRLRTVDVTPPPYNQPPYPPSGAVDTAACTIEIIVP